MMKLEEDCICMVIGWPETWSKGAEKFFGWFYNIGIVKDRYFKVGHAALCLIHISTGEVLYFDFGRYTCDYGQGRARGANTDPNLKIDIKAQIGKNGKVTNIDKIVDYLFSIVRFTHGEGSMYFSLYDKMNFTKSMQFIDNIQQQGSIKYTTFAPHSTNCSRFVAGVLMAGSTSKRDKIKLFFTPTLRASPVGTAVDVSYQSNVYRQLDKNAPLENFRMNRWGNIRLLFNNIKSNFVGKKVIRPDLIEAFERPAHVPISAHWLGGLGEGNWIDITPQVAQGVYRTRAFYHNGELNYDILVRDEKRALLPQKPFIPVYDCSRLFTSVEQQGKKIKLPFIQDFVSISNEP